MIENHLADDALWEPRFRKDKRLRTFKTVFKPCGCCPYEHCQDCTIPSREEAHQ